MLQFISDKRLSHQPGHAGLHLGQLLLIIEHVSLVGRCVGEAVLLQDIYLVELDELQEIKLWA